MTVNIWVKYNNHTRRGEGNETRELDHITLPKWRQLFTLMNGKLQIINFVLSIRFLITTQQIFKHNVSAATATAKSKPTHRSLLYRSLWLW